MYGHMRVDVGVSGSIHAHTLLCMPLYAHASTPALHYTCCTCSVYMYNVMIDNVPHKCVQYIGVFVAAIY